MTEKIVRNEPKVKSRTAFWKQRLMRLSLQWQGSKHRTKAKLHAISFSLLRQSLWLFVFSRFICFTKLQISEIPFWCYSNTKKVTIHTFIQLNQTMLPANGTELLELSYFSDRNKDSSGTTKITQKFLVTVYLYDVTMKTLRPTMPQAMNQLWKVISRNFVYWINKHPMIVFTKLNPKFVITFS